MKHRRQSLLSFIVVSILLGLSVGPAPVKAAEPLTIGVLHSESFSYATMMRNSYEMALDAVNAEGGIKGRPLRLVYADDEGEREAGEKAVRELAKKTESVMFIGGYSSKNTVYTARVANKLNIPFLICTAADDRITQRKWKNVFRLNPPAGEYANGLEDFFLKEVKPESLAILYENSPYGTGGALRMMWFCRENDIQISKIVPYHRERTKPEYFQNLVIPLKEEPPDVIYMVSYLKDAVLLLKGLRESAINSLLTGGAGGFTHPKILQMAGSATNNVVTATLWHQELNYSGTREYFNQYLGKYSVRPDYHGAEAYSALLVAADALRRAESHDPEGIRAALNQTDLETPFGPVRFQSYGKLERQNRLPTMVLQVIDGKFESIWPSDLATSKFVAPTNWRSSR
jgi:branched-chain amino acid transport system substrate-binding protein